jgi:hypothetical protein
MGRKLDRRTRSIAVAIAVTLLLGITGARAQAKDPDPGGQPPTAVDHPGKPHDTFRTATAHEASVPNALASAAATGPTDVVVSFDPSSGLAAIAEGTKDNADRAHRAAAADAAAEEYAAVKERALDEAGDGVTTVRDFDHLPVQIVRVEDADALDRLAHADGVASVNLPQRYHGTATPPHLALIHQPEALAAGATGAGVTVAVIDSGLDYQDAGVGTLFGDCSGGPGTGSCRIDRQTDVAGTGQLDGDDEKHGTNVASIVATVAPDAHFDIYGVLGPDGASDGDLLSALNDLSNHGAADGVRAINMSLGDGSHHTSECTASAFSDSFRNLRALGMVPVVASGNDAYGAGGFEDGVSSPACASGAIRVGAVYSENQPDMAWAHCTDNAPSARTIACFSQSGPLLSVLAPGLVVTAGGITMSGTSQATPHVAGAIADIADAVPGATSAELAHAVASSGPTITDPRNHAVTHLLDITGAISAAGAPRAEVDSDSCAATSIPANDDGSAPAAVDLPFTANFYGTSYGSLFVNNNGNVTFDASLATYTPFNLTADTPPIIAPFFGDVDTRGAGSGLTTYGTTTFGSRPAFCVNWNDVGYYSGHTDKLNSFQLLLVDRGDIGAGDFDIVMNYDTINWETGDASGGSNGFGGSAAGAGYSAGDHDPNHFFQFPGSLTHGGLLDTNGSTGLVNSSRNSLQPGRYIFPIRNGVAPGSASITGNVRDGNGAPQVAAPVQACPHGGGACLVGVTNGGGVYTVLGVGPGDWDLTANPPAGSDLQAAHAGPVAVVQGAATQQDLVLTGASGPPPGTTITDRGTTVSGVPVVYWQDDLTLATAGCAGATATYSITQGTTTLRSGPMAEGPAGHYSATVAAVYPAHGNATVSIALDCLDGPDASVEFSIYIDPSGKVLDENDAPVAGATVTLLRSDTDSGPFEPLPDGSAIMSPSNRTNPMVTGADGVFHWDVLAGFYKVTATKAGCTAPDGGTTSSSPVLAVPPPATDVVVRLDCRPAADHLKVTAPSSATKGTPVTVTVAAVDGAGHIDPRVDGPVTLISSPTGATFPSTPTLNDGTGSFQVTFHSTGTATIHATAGDLSGTSGSVTVSSPSPPPSPPTTSHPPAPGPQDPGTPADLGRIAGADRIGTAIAASQDAFPSNDSAGAVVVASSENYPDGLAGTPLAHALHAPLLLSSHSSLPGSVLDEIRRVLPDGGDVYLLGGTVALADPVGSAISGAGFHTQRVAGADRYGTAAAIADRIPSPESVLVATGLNFPDALAAGVAAAHAHGVVLFTQGSTVPSSTQSWLASHSSLPVVLIGGPTAGSVPGAALVAGQDRYETATLVADRFFGSFGVVGVASGVNFPDALSGGVHVATLGGPILLVQPNALPTVVRSWFEDHADEVDRVVLYGGTGAVGDPVGSAIVAATD